MSLRAVATMTLLLWFPRFLLCQTPEALAVCQAVIGGAAHNIELSTESEDFYDSLYYNYCEADGHAKQKWLNSGAKIVYGNMPMSGHEEAGKSEMDVKEFCSQYQNVWSKHRTMYTLSDKVVERALDTVRDCVHIAVSGVTVQHEFGGTPGALTLSITPPQYGGVKISSVAHQPYVTCVGPGETGHGNITYGVGTPYVVESGKGTYSIECTRTSTPLSGGKEYYKAADISLTSSAGAYHVFWPKATVEPEDVAEKIANQINTLTEQVNKLQLEMAAIGAKDGDQELHKFERGKDTDLYSCPAGQFVSGVAPLVWNSNHTDAVVGDIQVQCRKVVADSNKQ